MRRWLIILLVCAFASTGALPAHARAYWKTRLDRIAADRVGIALYDDGVRLYQNNARANRTPASNEKLILAMALFDAFDPTTRLRTSVYSPLPLNGVIEGDLWIQGQGDPTITAGGSYGDRFSFEPTRIDDLARAVIKSGVTTITGRVMGDTSYFARDWDAPGWRSNFDEDYIPFPTALTFEGNVHKGRHISDPEVRAARALTQALRKQGVAVAGVPDAGKMPDGLGELVFVESAPLSVLVRYMNRSSSNFFAEVLAKRLAVEVFGEPGSIAAGADALETFADALGITIAAFDGSGLSYSNRVSARGLVRLITATELTSPYYETLRDGLATGGQGTLEDRLHGVPVRAKTGSLTEISALSGWILLERTGEWAEFSILSKGMSYSAAKNLEDRLVSVMWRYAR